MSSAGGGYTPPELLDRFSQTFDVEVTLDLYDSNEAMLAKIEAGGLRLRYRDTLGLHRPGHDRKGLIACQVP